MSYCILSHLFRYEIRKRAAISFIDRAQTFTYEDLIKRAQSTIIFLRRRGVKKGDYVLLSFESEDDFIINFLSLMSLGAISVPVNPSITESELDKISKLVKFRFSLSSYSFLLTHSKSLSKISSFEGVLTTDEGPQEIPQTLFFLHSKVELSEEREDIQIPSAKQIMTCHFTLKGLGHPLGVEHSYEDYCSAVESCENIFHFYPGRRLLTLLPCYPVFGLVTNLLFPLTRGCELIIQDKRLSGILKAIEAYKIDHLNVVPVLMEKMLLEATKKDQSTDLSKLCIVAGGSYVSSELHNQFYKTFKLEPLQGYGLTETLPILTNRPGTSRPGTLGTLMRPQVELKLFDAKGIEVPQGKAGEICLRGQGIISHYIGEDEQFRDNFFRNGWLRTGDLGLLDEEGHVVFIGRRMSFTKVLGNMVDLKEIEDTVREVPGVKNARSYISMDRGREKLSLSIFVTRDFSQTRKELTEFLRTKLSTYKIPSLIKIYKSSYDEVL
jgi:long-chain acyl-CoA synthetase